MHRSFVTRVDFSLVLAAAFCGSIATCPAAGMSHHPTAGSCTNDPGGCPSGARAGQRHAAAPCGAGASGYAACRHGGSRHGVCGHGGCRHGAGCRPHHCCPGPCCHGACCHGLCEQIGHSIHHDVYEKRYFLRSQGKSWHSTWYDPSEGRPIALVVPPTAEFQTQYGWGVPSSRVAPIYHQFRRPYPGPGAVGGSGGGFLPTPNQPSDTVQFGVNAVRGPWGSY
jgi:hypothetical protein